MCSLKNLDSRDYHISYGSGGTEVFMDIDYNIYYPDGATKFRHNSGGERNFAEWQSHVHHLCSGCIYDPSSFVTDPLFVDPDNGDFRLQAGSPAVDMGVDVGFPFNGNAPDIGAFESDFISSGEDPVCDVDGDVNLDCNVTIHDLIMVATDFGKTSGYNSKADTDGNQVIDIFDIVYVARRFA